jgi:hypothetical protein
MVTQKRLQDLYEQGRHNSIDLPDGVTSEMSHSYDGDIIYSFHHVKLGEIGRIIVLSQGSNTNICYEVCGDQDDEITQKRREIFSPVAKQIADASDKILGPGITSVSPYDINHGNGVVASKVFPCEICNQPTSMMIEADDAITEGELQHYASMMRSNIKRFNIPTWVVGKEIEITLSNGSKTGKSLIMKVWPSKEQAKIMYAEEFNNITEAL